MSDVARVASWLEGADGLWRSFRPENLVTPQAFARDPRPDSSFRLPTCSSCGALLRPDVVGFGVLPAIETAL